MYVSYCLNSGNLEYKIINKKQSKDSLKLFETFFFFSSALYSNEIAFKISEVMDNCKV